MTTYRCTYCKADMTGPEMREDGSLAGPAPCGVDCHGVHHADCCPGPCSTASTACLTHGIPSRRPRSRPLRPYRADGFPYADNRGPGERRQCATCNGTGCLGGKHGYGMCAGCLGYGSDRIEPPMTDEEFAALVAGAGTADVVRGALMLRLMGSPDPRLEILAGLMESPAAAPFKPARKEAVTACQQTLF